MSAICAPREDPTAPLHSTPLGLQGQRSVWREHRAFLSSLGPRDTQRVQVPLGEGLGDAAGRAGHIPGAALFPAGPPSQL